MGASFTSSRFECEERSDVKKSVGEEKEVEGQRKRRKGSREKEMKRSEIGRGGRG